MHIVYIDDSGDEVLSAFSALVVPADQWKQCFAKIKQFRTDLRKSDGIYVKKELHAWKFVSGRGRIAPTRIKIERRVEIFAEAAAMIQTLPGVCLINACDKKGTEARLMERLLNRVHVNMYHRTPKSHAVVISDEGKQGPYLKLYRKLAAYNPVPSKYEYWPSGQKFENLPTERLIEDIIFKDSRDSYFIQLADFCAYALLRFQNPIPSKAKHDLHLVFPTFLQPICVKEAFAADQLGIIRAT